MTGGSISLDGNDLSQMTGMVLSLKGAAGIAETKMEFDVVLGGEGWDTVTMQGL